MTSSINQSPTTDIVNWLVQQGLEGAEQAELLEGYSMALVAAGLPLKRLHVAQSAFHPRYGGVGFDWTRDAGLSSETYEFTDQPRDVWLQSPLYHMLNADLRELHLPLDDAETCRRFPLLADLRAQGATDYFATGLVLSQRDNLRPIDPNNAPEGALISWTSDAPGGFSPTDLALIRSGLPYLGLALKSASNRKMARELLGVYLGADAGSRVLSGEIQRGSLEKIDAAILFFDLIGFTSMAEQMDGAHMVKMLNAYFGVAVRAIEGQGGNVLKFMGDGLLAMFDLGDARADADAALEAAAQMEREIDELNASRTAAGLPATGYTLALHNGEVFYGNIGADSRLDFTVIGPAVNQTARLSDMHRAVGRNTIVSESFREAAGPERGDLVSLGRYMLRGVPEPQELFTIYPDR